VQECPDGRREQGPCDLLWAAGSALASALARTRLQSSLQAGADSAHLCGCLARGMAL
jgi:hypothetical protein